MKNILLLSVCFCLSSCGLATPEGFVKIAVVDEDGQRIEGCHITVSFEKEGKYIRKTGFSQTNAFFEAQASADLPRCTVIINKDGYYESRQTKMFTGRDRTKNRYEPWGEVRTLVLRKIIDPNDGIKGGVNDRIPKMDTPLGFDLMENDWVAPFGKGVNSDFFITCSYDDEGKVASYSLLFPNKGDGVFTYHRKKGIQSTFIWPHKAPANGYLQMLKAKRTYASGDKTKLPDFIELPREASALPYIFRIRTEYDDEGNIISAYYGKMRSAVQVNWNKTVQFGYWLNDDSQSRSLESTHPTSP
ncbi:hypothetical protein EGM51_15320 [Verrucomicrobia bacterium S94]|nr:hypothetical protein EGM51_15320 [Verrucomicrobia bacterium S94]